MTPGSVKVVRSKELIVKKYSTAPTMGITGLMRVARNGQLQERQRERDRYIFRYIKREGVKRRGRQIVA